MARPQQFDRDDVLDRALLVFWRHGFEGASIQHLVDATGLNRGSLYNAFGDKAQLFAEVMDRYRANSPARCLAEAAYDPDSSADVHRLIEQFFDALVQRALNDGDHKGCLFTNTSAGVYGCTDAMADWIRESLRGLEDVLTILIERGQQNGQIQSSVPASALARSLLASAQGLNVLARTGAEPDVLKDIATMAIRTLNR